MPNRNSRKYANFATRESGSQESISDAKFSQKSQIGTREYSNIGTKV